MSTLSTNKSYSSTSSSSLSSSSFVPVNAHEIDSKTLLPSSSVGSTTKRSKSKKNSIVKDKPSTVSVSTLTSTTTTSSALTNREALPSASTSSSSSTVLSTSPLTHYVGYHASGAGGIWKALEAGHSIGAKALAFFTRSSRTWNCPSLKPTDIEKFHQLMHEYNYTPQCILPHGTYLSNLGCPPGTDLYTKSIEGVYDEALRCYQLGLLYYNFHPGSFKYCETTSTSLTNKEGKIIVRKPNYQGCYNVAQAINTLHQRIPRIIFVIENMAGQGSILGSTFEEIRYMIDHVQDKVRVGVCIDTAHAHGSGYDLTNPRTYHHMMNEFDKIIGIQYLKGMHLNDSKVELHSNKDRHENIGHGYIGIEGFRCIMNDSRTAHIPLILETPCNSEDKDDLTIYRQEIALLYSLQGTKEGDPVELPPRSAGKKSTTTKKKRKNQGTTDEENEEEEDEVTQKEKEEEEETGKMVSLVSSSSSSSSLSSSLVTHEENNTKGPISRSKKSRRTSTTSTKPSNVTKEEDSTDETDTTCISYEINSNVSTPDINKTKVLRRTTSSTSSSRTSKHYVTE